MARHPMPLGTFGKIRYAKTAGGWRAKARYRGHNGVMGDLSRSGRTKTAAERALKLALNQVLQTSVGGEFTARTRFREVAKPWLERQEQRAKAGERAEGTIDNYRSILHNRVLVALGELQLFEISVGRLNKFLYSVKVDTSAAHARTARAVIGGILQYAVSSGALTTNPIRDVDRIEGGPTKLNRALTVDERRQWLAQLEQDPKAVRDDLPDLTRFMMATGVRIGEALALYWEDVRFRTTTRPHWSASTGRSSASRASVCDVPIRRRWHRSERCDFRSGRRRCFGDGNERHTRKGVPVHTRCSRTRWEACATRLTRAAPYVTHAAQRDSPG